MKRIGTLAGGLFVVLVVAVVLLLVLPGRRSPEADVPERLPAATLDPCGGPDHPCALADATPDASRRTRELTDLLQDRLLSPEDLPAAAAWLELQDGVASVATGEEALRFRVRGGVGHWVFIRTAGSIGTLSASTVLLSAPPAVFAVGAMAAQLPAADPDTRRKKALLLSPFRWQWEIQGRNDGIDEVAAALKARDYQPEDVTVWTTRLDPGNPACQSVNRWPDCRTINDIQPGAFTSWREYDYIHLLTHGGAVREGDHTLTAVMTPWTLEAVEAAAAQATGDALTVAKNVGTESATVLVTVPREAVPMVGPGQLFREGVPLVVLRGDRGEAVPHPGLTPTEREWCAEQLRVKSDADRRTGGLPLAETDGGKPCVQYSEYPLSTGEFVMLTSRFFYQTYGDGAGIDDAVVLISACSSGVSPELLGALRGRNTAAIGWKKSVSIGAAAIAGTLIAKALVEVDQAVEGDSGLTVRQAVRRIRDMLDEAAADPPTPAECGDPGDSALEARCLLAYDTHSLTVVNDEPADALTGASLVIVGDESVRAREVAYLMNKNGQELRDGATLPLVGTLGAGAAAVDLTIRVDGLRLEDDPTDVALEVSVDDRRIPVKASLERELADGVWELDHRLPLGRDYENGEVVDVEVRAELPDGGESRWTYRKIRLEAFWWQATVTGGPVAFPVLSGRHVQHQMHVVVGQTDSSGPTLYSPPALSIALRTGRSFTEGTNTGVVTVRFDAPDYSCSGSATGAEFRLTLNSVDPIDGVFEGPVLCTPGRLVDPVRARDAIKQAFRANATGRFRVP